AHVTLDAPPDLAVRRRGVNADADGAPVPDGDLDRHLRAARDPASIEERAIAHGTRELGIRQIRRVLRPGREVQVVAGDGGFIARSARATRPVRSFVRHGLAACLTSLARFLFRTGTCLFSTTTVSDPL